MDYNTMTNTELFLRYGVALIVGFLVGLQREFSYGDLDKSHAAGVRTFSMLGLLGCASAHVGALTNSILPFVAIILVLGALLTINYYLEARSGRIGMTTKVTSVLTVLIGALAFHGQIPLAVALGVAATVLLSLKIEMHKFVHHITRDDLYATLKFAVITAIILPILPDKNFGPPTLEILNPFKIWVLVVLISAISFVGYVLIKLVGTRRGIGLTGLMGGLVSSTAVTLSFTQRSRTNQELSRPFALAIIIAWTIMYLRVIVVVAALNIALAQLVWIPLLAASVLGFCYCGYLFFAQRSDKTSDSVKFANPFELGPAIKFGFLFMVILLISKVAQTYMGNVGVYLSSFVSGLADVDAIALSMARLSKPGAGIDLSIAAQAIVLATVANTLLKGAIVMVSGSSGLRRALLPGYIIMLIASIGVMFLL